MDALSHTCDHKRPLNWFSTIRNDDCIAKVATFEKLVFDELGNIKPIFSKIEHTSYVFLPVHDLQKSTSGRLGVHSMSSFLEDPQSEIGKDVVDAEIKLRETVFDIFKAKLPPILRQFVIQNDTLILLWLYLILCLCQKICTLTTCMAFLIHNLDGFWLWIATNIAMCTATPQRMTMNWSHLWWKNVPFKSSSYYHSGVYCACDGECNVAAPWYQDCVVQHSTGSVRKFSSNANSFTNAFNTLSKCSQMWWLPAWDVGFFYTMLEHF